MNISKHAWLDRDRDGAIDAVRLLFDDGSPPLIVSVAQATLWPPFWFSPSCQLTITVVKYRDARTLAEGMGLVEDDCYRLKGEPVIILFGGKPYDTNGRIDLESAALWTKRWREGQLEREQAERERLEKVRKAAEREAAANSPSQRGLYERAQSAAMQRAAENHPQVKIRRLEEQVAELTARLNGQNSQ